MEIRQLKNVESIEGAKKHAAVCRQKTRDERQLLFEARHVSFRLELNTLSHPPEQHFQGAV